MKLFIDKYICNNFKPQVEHKNLHIRILYEERKKKKTDKSLLYSIIDIIITIINEYYCMRYKDTNETNVKFLLYDFTSIHVSC